jgi:TonB-linked SusC/RagA family outer membrane protein
MRKNKYSIMKKGIFITGVLTFFCFVQSFAQQKTISGNVTSAAAGQPLAGVTVLIKGSSQATQTNPEGNFTISIPSSSQALIFSFVGYETQEVDLNGMTELSIQLQLVNSKLNEVVVIGYGSQKRKDLTGSISSVNAETIEKVPVTTLDQALQGRAAGVQVTNNDGAPGGNMTVLIRGVGSLASYGNGPLYVVDGYPVSSGINNINPDDIESIQVLKDASATAIYGIRAANGVVLVTTKKGKKGKTQISLDAYNAFQSRPKTYDVLNAEQWATLANEVADADSQHNFNELPIWRTPSALTNVDWQDALYRPGLTQSYTLAIRGGSDKVQASTSAGYYNQKGIVLGSYFKRFTLGLNLDYTPTKWLRSSTSARYSYQNSNTPFGTNSLTQLTELPPTLDSGNKFTSLIKDANGNYGFFNPKNTYVAKYSNPVYAIENNQYRNISNYFLGSSSLEATIINGLKIKTNAGVNITTYDGSYYQPEDNRLNEQYNLGGATQNALYSQHLNQTFEWLWENTVSYDRTFGDHMINFVGGISAQKNTWTGMGGSGIPPNAVIRDLSQVGNLQLDVNNPTGTNTGNGQNIYTLESQFARLTYGYKDKYLITGTIRRDGSSKFDTGHQYGTFPSGAIAWKIKQESFLRNADWLSELKVRGSYGVVGNQSTISLFKYQALYSTGGPATLNPGNLGYPFDKIYQGGIAATQPVNPKLRWETDYQTDIGLDAGFLNGDLTLTMDWFNRKSKDFLLTLAAPAQSGYNFLTRNVGTAVNKGLEIALNYNHTVKDFNYGLAMTFTTVDNTLTSITSGTNFVTNFGGLTLPGIGWTTFTETNIGQPIGEFYGYKSLGIFQSKAQVDALNAAAAAKNPANQYYQKSATGAGDRYFADTNGDGHVTADDQVSLGSPLPKFYGGLNLDASYKAWDFNVYFYGVYGNKILNYQKSALESFQNRSFVGVENVSVEYFKNHWTPDNPSNTYSRATYNDDAVGSNVPSSAWIEDGSFLKLKNITVGYTFPSSIINKISASKLRLYVSAQNLFTITKYSGLDPEIGLQNGNATQNGVDNGTYPSSRYFTVGLNLLF